MTSLRQQEQTAMSRETQTGIQKSESADVSKLPEQTRPGPVYTPATDIFENEHTITVLADMPGVKASDLKIDLRENVLTLTGRVTLPESSNAWDVLREFRPGTFLRQFTLSETIDQAKIDAKLADGVLRLELPKLERAKPRQITIRTE
jgi:HSP20 family protein